jgi:predicted nucleic acid-binding protein
MRCLVDTDVLVDASRNLPGVFDYFDSLGDDWAISSISALELMVGAKNAREVSDIDVVVSTYDAIPPNDDITRRAYNLIKTYAKSHGLRTLDSLIAATALEDGLTLVTKNRKHFAMIEGLHMQIPEY